MMANDVLSPDQELLNARVLVVDDQAVNVKLLEKILDAAGYRNVVTTTDSREAASLFQESPTDLVLLDLNMPHKDGFEVLTEIKAMEKDYPPVIVLTALKDVDSRVKALENGARDFISKPFDRVELLSRMHNMLEVRLLHKAARNQNIILEERVRERTQELEETRMEIIRRLGRAAEYRDNETGLHIIRMSKFSQVLALAAGMDEEDAEMILNASPMHDIGKIGIPDAILLKPGKLDASEWTTMKKHSTIGAKILSGHPSALMQMAREIALTHHEKWDGSGYPMGLRGEKIPFSGLIVALADVFDALTSERPYKNAWPVDEAVTYIKENSGKHFEPCLVELFIASLDKIIAIRDKYAEPGE